MKTKTKIRLTVIFVFISTVITSLIALSLNNTKYNMPINKPSRIIVYCGNVTNNQVFEPNSEEFDKIYSLLIKSYQQPILKAFVEGELGKNAKIEHTDNKSVNFGGIVINFEYDTPQVVGYKNKVYNYNNSTFWYQNLIFEISNNNTFEYNKVAIVPPVGDIDYVSPHNYKLVYLAYSNFSQVYGYVNEMFD